MAIQTRVLGRPGRDNAVHAVIDSGQRRTPLLFDCGEGCVAELSASEKHEIQHVFFSHFHMDHIAGFDGFFRANYDRPDLPIHVWGPPGTIDVMHHRFRGFLWNLHADRPGTWIVHEIHPGKVNEATFHLADAFSERHAVGSRKTLDGEILVDPEFTIRAMELDHHGPSIAYRIDESEQCNIDPTRLAETNLRPGPWLESVKAEAPGEIEIEGQTHALADLKATLLVTAPGESFAYLTDFHSNAPELIEWLRNCDHVVCEAQYLHRDLALAIRNAHMTTQLVGKLASEAGIANLTLFHLSERYQPGEWIEMLNEVRMNAPEASFPDFWEIA